jgi:hypothetical protein
MGYFVYILAVSDLVGVKEAEASFYNRPDPDPQAEKSKPISRESTLQLKLKLKRKKQKVERKDSVNCHELAPRCAHYQYTEDMGVVKF